MNRYIYGIVAVAALLCLLPTQSSATPSVSWSRLYIKRMLIPGQAGAETVTFTATSSLSNVSVTVVPALQPFLKVSPSYFNSISAGRSYSVTLNSTIPSNKPVGTLINGTVHLKAGSTTIARPLAVVLDVEAASSRNPDPQSIVQDGFISYPVNEIVVTFSGGSNLTTAQTFASTIHGTVVGALPEIDTYQIVVNATTISGLTALIAQLRSNPPIGVVGVSRNYISAAPSAAPTDLENLKTCAEGATNTIAYDSARITGAWQIARLANPIRIPRNTTVGLLDTGVQVVIGTTPLGQVFQPEFSAPPVNFGNTPPESLVDTEFVGGKQGHGTEVAGIVGANNRSDPSLGLDYQCPAMNGIISGVPNILGRYTLEERVGPNATITTQLADTVSSTTSGARIVLLEMLNTATARLTADQLNTGAACEFSAVNDILDLEINYVRWSNLFKVHSDVLFVLPAGNYDQQLPQLTSASQLANVVSLVGGMNRDNTITVGAFDPTQPDTNVNYRAVWGVTPSGVTCSASNFGPGVDIAAPGSHVFAPKPTDLAHLTANDFYIDSFQGTSASAPFVAGAAALLYAIDPALPLDPSKVPLHLKNTLIATADSLLPAFAIGNRLNVCRAAKNALGAQFQLPTANPNNSAVNVAINISAILLNFSLPIDATTLPTSFLISGSGQPPTGSLQISDDKRSILFVLSQGLQSGTVYHVDLSPIKDVCGDSLPAGTTYAFTTVASVILPPDLTITKTASPSPVTSGGTLTYTITAQNAAGTADALNVTVTDPLPTGVSFTSCSVSTGGCSALNGTVTALFGTLAGGASATLTITATAPTVTSSTTLTNTATVSTTSTESNTANDSATQIMTVTPAGAAGGGPPGGSIVSLVIDPVNSMTIYAGSGGGLFKTTDRGQNWRAANAGLPLNASVLAIAIDPSNTATIYAAIGGNGIFKSTDGGQQWSFANLLVSPFFGRSNDVTSLLVDPMNTATLYAGTLGAGVFKTTDRAQTWSSINSGLSNDTLFVNSMAINPQISSTLFATTNGGVVTSTDGGQNWSILPVGRIQDLAVNSALPSTLYGVGGNFFFRSVDGGQSWNTINVLNLPVTESAGLIALAIDPNRPGTLYIGSSGGRYGVLKSTDEGQTWSSVSTGLPHRALGVFTLAVDPAQAGVVYAGTEFDGVIASDDGGQNWSVRDAGLAATQVIALGIDPVQSSTVYAITSFATVPGFDDLFKSINGGQTWNTADSGFTSNTIRSLAVDPVNPSILYAGIDVGVFKSTNSGQSWSAGQDVGMVIALAIDPTNTSTIYGGLQRGGLIKSTNGGGTWDYYGTGLGLSVSSLIVDPVNSAVLYALSSGSIFKSTDSGQSWSNKNVSVGNGILALDPVMNTTIYATSSGGSGVFKSTDAGQTWVIVNSGLSGEALFTSAISIDPTSNIYIGTRLGIFKSTNGGSTWSLRAVGLTNTIILSIAIDPASPDRVYVGTLGGGVFRSFDGGATWAH